MGNDAADKNLDRNGHAGKPAQIGKISLSIRSVQPVLMYVTARGYDRSDLLKANGVDPLIFRDPEARLPQAQFLYGRGRVNSRRIPIWGFMSQQEFDQEFMERWITQSVRARRSGMGCDGLLSIIVSCTTWRRRDSESIVTARSSVIIFRSPVARHARFRSAWLLVGCSLHGRPPV